MDGYPINQSCLYKLSSPNKLAKLLPVSVEALETLVNVDGRYECWDEPKKSGGTRRIEAPHANLKTLQKRISDLLQRIAKPDYLMAPVKGRSYVDNAAAHIGSRSFRLLDIEDFFPSCTDKRVYWFFHKRMLCATHVAALLTKLVTFKGHLPQGSPCSPVLAYYAYEDMWEEISQIVTASNCKLSIYADDITISGETIYEKDIWALKSCLFRFGFSFSEKKERRLIHKPADITGVIVKHKTLLLPNRQHQKLNQINKALSKARAKSDRERLQKQVHGRISQAEQITSHIKKNVHTDI